MVYFPQCIMHYFAGLLNHGIMYMMGDGGLVRYTDANWANNTTNQCSISGYMFLYSGGAVSWMSKQQSTTTLSSMHAKYIATSKAAKELVWLCHLLSKVRENVQGPTTLYINNRAVDLLV